MKKNVPDERKTKAILELICALDGRIVKVEDAGDGLVMIYANIAQYPGEEDYADDELLDDELDELLLVAPLLPPPLELPVSTLGALK